MSIIEVLLVSIGCAFAQQPIDACISQTSAAPSQQVAGVTSQGPVFTGDSLGVVLESEAAIVWDVKTGTVLFEKEADTRRPIASLSKLVSALAIRSALPSSTVVEIPAEVRTVQRRGVHIKLPPGEHATVEDLLAASMIRSANDAIVTLAIATKGSEDVFVEFANRFAHEHGMNNTLLANASGLEGGEQYSTARDVMEMITLASQDPKLSTYLSENSGVLTTEEGTRLPYETTNKLLGTYLPVIAAKTGYTESAGENLALITRGRQGQQIGAVVLGSDQRFQDMKILIEWIQRNWTW